MGNWQQQQIKPKLELFFNISSAAPREVFYLFTLTLLSLLLPLSFLLLAKLSAVQYHLQQYSPHYPFPSYLLYLALRINPCILYVVVFIISVASLIHGLTGKIIITVLRDSSSSDVVFQPPRPRLYFAWILLCTFQVCVGLGIEGSIAAGFYDSDSDHSGNFGVERSLLSGVAFLLGLHETTRVWCGMVVRPVVDDTVFGGVARKERWVERVVMGASLGTLWWWRLRDDVETLVFMGEAKKEQLNLMMMDDDDDVGFMNGFVGWWLYYLTVTIGIVRVVKGLMWIMAAICPCRTRISRVELEPSQNDDKV